MTVQDVRQKGSQKQAINRLTMNQNTNKDKAESELENKGCLIQYLTHFGTE